MPLRAKPSRGPSGLCGGAECRRGGLGPGPPHTSTRAPQGVALPGPARPCCSPRVAAPGPSLAGHWPAVPRRDPGGLGRAGPGTGGGRRGAQRGRAGSCRGAIYNVQMRQAPFGPWPSEARWALPAVAEMLRINERTVQRLGSWRSLQKHSDKLLCTSRLTAQREEPNGGHGLHSSDELLRVPGWVWKCSKLDFSWRSILTRHPADGH